MPSLRWIVVACALGGALAAGACQSIEAVPIDDDDEDAGDATAPPSPDASRGAPDAALDAEAELEAGANEDAGLRAPRAIWFPTSRRVEYYAWGYWSGGSRYRKDRAELTADQLTALASAQTHDGGGYTEVYDALVEEVTVEDEDGGVETYTGTRPQRQRDTLDTASIRPFAATFRCLTKAAYAYATPAQPDAGEPAGFPLLSTDTGCEHGVLFGAECMEAYARFDVADAATYEIALSPTRGGGSCRGLLRVKVYSEDRATLIAASDPADAGTACTQLRHAFAPGHYVVGFTKDNPGGCAIPTEVSEYDVALARE